MSAFTFTSNVPDGPNDPSEDQPIMEVNNNSIEDIWDVDHVGFNLNQGGTHNVVRLNDQQANPKITSSQSAFFQRMIKNANAPSGATEGMYRYGNGTQNLYQLTDFGPTAGTNGESNLFSPAGTPIRIKWGQVSNPGLLGSVSFLTAFSSPPYMVQLTLQRSGGTDSTAVVSNTTPPTASGLNYICNNNTSNVLYWMAIGS